VPAPSEQQKRGSWGFEGAALRRANEVIEHPAGFLPIVLTEQLRRSFRRPASLTRPSPSLPLSLPAPLPDAGRGAPPVGIGEGAQPLPRTLTRAGLEAARTMAFFFSICSEGAKPPERDVPGSALSIPPDVPLPALRRSGPDRPPTVRRASAAPAKATQAPPWKRNRFAGPRASMSCRSAREKSRILGTGHVGWREKIPQNMNAGPDR